MRHEREVHSLHPSSDWSFSASIQPLGESDHRYHWTFLDNISDNIMVSKSWTTSQSGQRFCGQTASHPGVLFPGSKTPFTLGEIRSISSAIMTHNSLQMSSRNFWRNTPSHSTHTLTPIYCPQRNGLLERFNRVLKSGSQVLSAQGGNFYDGMRKILTNFWATAPEYGKPPAILMRGWNIRTEADIRNPLLFAGGVNMVIAKRKILDQKQREEIFLVKAEKRRYAKGQQNIPSPGFQSRGHSPVQAIQSGGSERSISKIQDHPNHFA